MSAVLNFPSATSTSPGFNAPPLELQNESSRSVRDTTQFVLAACVLPARTINSRVTLAEATTSNSECFQEWRPAKLSKCVLTGSRGLGEHNWGGSSFEFRDDLLKLFARVLRNIPQAESSRSRRISEVRNEILGFELLPIGWDGPNSRPARKDAVNDVLPFLDLLPPDVPVPAPMIEANGEVALYWRTPELYLEIGFLGIGAVEFWGRVGTDGEEISGTQNLDRHMVPSNVFEFLRRNMR